MDCFAGVGRKSRYDFLNKVSCNLAHSPNIVGHNDFEGIKWLDQQQHRWREPTQ